MATRSGMARGGTEMMSGIRDVMETDGATRITEGSMTEAGTETETGRAATLPALLSAQCMHTHKAPML